jgi:hypothetical protein
MMLGPTPSLALADVADILDLLVAPMYTPIDKTAIRAPSPIFTLSEPNMEVLTTAPKLGTVWSVDSLDLDATAAALAGGSFFGGGAIFAGGGAAGGCAAGAAGALFTATGFDTGSVLGGPAGGVAGGFSLAESTGPAAFLAGGG